LLEKNPDKINWVLLSKILQPFIYWRKMWIKLTGTCLVLTLQQFIYLNNTSLEFIGIGCA